MVVRSMVVVGTVVVMVGGMVRPRQGLGGERGRGQLEASGVVELDELDPRVSS